MNKEDLRLFDFTMRKEDAATVVSCWFVRYAVSRSGPSLPTQLSYFWVLDLCQCQKNILPPFCLSLSLSRRVDQVKKTTASVLLRRFRERKW